MKKNRSIDDLRTAHLHLARSAEAQLLDMPEYFLEEKAALDAVYGEIEAAVRSRTCVGVQKASDFAQRKEWTSRAVAALSRAKLLLRAKAPELVRDYFPEVIGAASRRIDRLHYLTNILTVSEHFDHAHLGELRVELEALRIEGQAIFGAASVSTTVQKTEVERLRELKAQWEMQYQKLRFLFRGYFHGTATDYMKFFDEKRLARGAHARDGVGSAAAPAPAALDS